MVSCLRSFFHTMNNILRDLRYGLRTLTRNPGFTAVAVLTIGIGIGASTTIFSWMRSMLLNPLPGATQAERIVAIENMAPDGEPITTSLPALRKLLNSSATNALGRFVPHFLVA